jgi:putative flippase GtrA
MLDRELVRFLVVGGINTLCGYVIYLVFNLFLAYKIAYTIAYVAGILISYSLNAKWVFKSGPSWKSFVVFPSVYLVQYLISILLLGYIVVGLGVPETLAFIPVVILTIPVTFGMSKVIFLFLGEDVTDQPEP